jgi:LytTr DNA-binding domain-containing protein
MSLVSRVRVLPRPAIIVGSWLVVAAAAACLFTAQMIFAGMRPRASIIAEGLLIIPLWMLITPVVLRMAERAPITRHSWPRRLPAFAALWLAFFIASNVIIRLPFPELRENFLKKLAFGLSVFLPGSALAFAALVVIGHVVARRGASRRSAELILRDGARTFVVPSDDVDWIEAEDNYVLVHTLQRSYTVRQRIRDVESQLDGTSFVRVHRSAIVRVGRIAEVRPLSHGDFEVVMRGGASVRGSRSRRAALDVIRGRYSATK